MIKRFENGSWVDIESYKRFDGTQYIDAENVKRYMDGEWITVYTNKIPILDLPNGSKIKYGDISMTKVDNNHNGYPENSVQVVYNPETAPDYTNSYYNRIPDFSEWQTVAENAYELLLPIELKSTLLTQELSYQYANSVDISKNDGKILYSDPIISKYMFPQPKEFGFNDSATMNKSNFEEGFWIDTENRFSVFSYIPNLFIGKTYPFRGYNASQYADNSPGTWFTREGINAEGEYSEIYLYRNWVDTTISIDYKFIMISSIPSTLYVRGSTDIEGHHELILD